MKNYIKIVEAANKGCPIATHDLEVNVKNRQTAIDKHHYGPAYSESQVAKISANIVWSKD